VYSPQVAQELAAIRAVLSIGLVLLIIPAWARLIRR